LRGEFEQTALGVAFRKEHPIEAVADADDFPPEFVRRENSTVITALSPRPN
jgi:hypothetical protein